MNQVLKDRLKSLFLAELSIDEGWSAYLDLLLSSIDDSFLDILSEKGLPFHIVFVSASSPKGPIVPLSDGISYLLSSAADYGKVEVLVRSSEVQQVVEVFSEGERVVFDGSVSEEFIELDSSFQYKFTVKTPTASITQRYLPSSLNPKALMSLRSSKRLQPLISPTTSPQALFGAMSQLTGLSFRIVYKSSQGSGVKFRSYDKYVKRWNTQEGANSVSFVTDTPVHLDAVRDRFGYGDQQSSILGYDKCYVVSTPNAPEAKIIGLVANYADPGTSSLSVSPNKVDFPQHSNPVPLPIPQFTITPRWVDILTLKVTVTLNPYPDPDVTFPDHNIKYRLVQELPEIKQLVPDATTPQWTKKEFTLDMSEVPVGEEPTRIAVQGQWLSADTTEADSPWATTSADVSARPGPMRLPKPNITTAVAEWNEDGTAITVTCEDTPSVAQVGHRIYWECLFNGSIVGGKEVEGGSVYTHTYAPGRDTYEPASVRCYYLANNEFELDSNAWAARLTIPERPIPAEITLSTSELNFSQQRSSREVTVSYPEEFSAKEESLSASNVVNAEDSSFSDPSAAENEGIIGFSPTAATSVKGNTLVSSENHSSESDPSTPKIEVVSESSGVDSFQDSVKSQGFIGFTPTAATNSITKSLKTASSSLKKALSSRAYGDGFGEHPSKAKVKVRTTPSSGFTTDFAETDDSSIRAVWLYGNVNGQTKYLLSPGSVLPSNRFGITKYYDMLTLIDGPLQEISVVFTSVVDQSADLEALEAAIETLIANSIPAGVRYSIDYVYPQVESSMQVLDTPNLTETAIYVNGHTGDVPAILDLGQRSQSVNVDVQTRPGSFVFDVKKN